MRFFLAIAVAIALLGCQSPAQPGSAVLPEVDFVCAATNPPADPQVVPPRRRSTPQPPIPRSAPCTAYACFEGVVNTDGRLDAVALVGTDNQDWATTAEKTLRKWRFWPATKDGVAVAYPMAFRLTFSFKMLGRPC